MTYNPLIHNRQSTRRKGYDYSQPGYYFVTLCVQYRRRLFGVIPNRKMLLNPAGIMVDHWWRELENKFPNIVLHEFVVMPDHFHGIIEISAGADSVGADLRVRLYADNSGTHADNSGTHAESSGTHADNSGTHANNSGTHADNSGTHANNSGTHADNSGTHADNSGTHAGVPLGTMVQWFKTMTTNVYIRGVRDNDWPRFEKRMWQRNYFDRIIENETYLRRVRNYIIQNPMNWTGG